MPTPDAAPRPPRSYADPAQFDKFRRHLDPAAIDAALTATGRQSRRHRRLPMPQVVALVVAMALYRHLSLEQIVLTLRLATKAGRRLTVASSTIAAARDRLGVKPLARLFRATAPRQARAHAEAPAHRWRGLSLWGVDGSSLRVPDTGANRAHFGGHTGGARGESGYPLVRLVALMALTSRLLAEVRFGPFARGEVGLARKLWASIPDVSLTIVDRNFLSAAILLGIQRAGTQRHWLIRLKSNTRYRILRMLRPGDWLVEWTVSREARAKDPTLPATFQARVLHYQRRGFRAQKLMTSLLDPAQYPAAEIAVRYHARWELELALDEIKTEVLDRHEALRSKRPTRVRQEIWGLALAYNVVRREVCAAADRAGVEAARVSFVTVLRRLRTAWLVWGFTGGEEWPPLLRAFYETLEGLILRKRRPDRGYPRAVKLKMSSYAKKRRPTAAQTAEIVRQLVA